MSPVRMDWLDPADPRLEVVLPYYQPLLDALLGTAAPERRTVPVAELRMEPEFEAPEAFVAVVAANLAHVKRLDEEFMVRPMIPVMERSDGSLWVYDDCATVAAIRRVHPAAEVECAVYKDPTR